MGGIDRNGPFRWCWPDSFPPGQYRYIDLEADTEETYWLVLRGLLLLYQDAQVGRFAKQRAAGIGGSSTTAT